MRAPLRDRSCALQGEIAPLQQTPAGTVARHSAQRFGKWGGGRIDAARRLLSDEDVRTIRHLAATAYSADLRNQLAARYGVSVATIGEVIRGDSYPGVAGLPLTERRWKSSYDSRTVGLLVWLIWLLTVTRPVRTSGPGVAQVVMG